MSQSNTAPHLHADLLPIRMCAELVYCPRLFHLEHVQGIFVHSSDTIDGRSEHDRARRRGSVRRLAVAGDEPPPWSSLPRKLLLQSEAWGVRGEEDLLELDGDRVVAVESKHGASPRTESHMWEDHALPYRAWPGDVAQLGLYIALLREAGLPCDGGRVFYRGDRATTEVPWSFDLERFLLDVVARAREVARLVIPPEPLRDSPKCLGCSLHGVCLPDEHHALQAVDDSQAEVRRIVPSRDDRAVVYVTTPGTVVGKQSESLTLRRRDGVSERVLLKDVAHVAIVGPSYVTGQCMTLLLDSGVSVSHHTSGGRLVGFTSPIAARNVGLRRAQFRAADDRERTLAVARAIVLAKVHNQRTVLRRWRRGATVIAEDAMGGPMPEWADASEPTDERDERDARASCAVALRQMLHAQRAAQRAGDLDVLRGHEGEAAAAYFGALPQLLPPAWRADLGPRSRRPPRDRVNAMLGLGYALLCRDAISACVMVGLDPMLGFLHTMIAGRPALALDLMEPFRAAWVDVAILRLLATQGLGRDDFLVSSLGVTLTDAGRRAFIGAYERRADELTTHPRFGYRMSYRRLLELEARVLAKSLGGEIDDYVPLRTR
jgi:CRISPR-associated protein Cas1